MSRIRASVDTRSSINLMGASRRHAVTAAETRSGSALLRDADAERTRHGAAPHPTHGVAIGDVRPGRAVIWSRASETSRLLVEHALEPSFREAVTVRGPRAVAATDYTARVELRGLPADREVFVRVSFAAGERRGGAVTGRFRTAPATRRDVRFLWSGDTAGQGFGINPEFGGMRMYETMRRTNPDFFIHSGDTVYADGPILPVQIAEDGREWRNVVTPEVAKVAETLAEFRGRFRYNLLDENVRRFNAEVPQIWQWDDHEVVNNWSPAKDLSADDRYTEKDVRVLVERARRAFLEYAPLHRPGGGAPDRIYRRIPYGPLLEVFVLDMRSYRGPNSYNRQERQGPDTAFLGATQLRWLEHALARSRALWKVIAADMPLGLVIGDGEDEQGRPRFEGIANGDGPPLGRELELAELLSFIKARRIANVVWLTADVHYCAAHRYDPARAQFKDFEPFWEFVAGPLNAGSFGPNLPDDTFGLDVVFQRVPPGQNYSPFAGYQFFGQVDIDGRTGTMTVHLKDLEGATLFTQTLEPRVS